MAPISFSASAPGSLMLMGEHAVLERKTALVCAVDKRICITLRPNDVSQEIRIIDAKLGTLSINLSDLRIQDPFKFVLSAIMLFKSEIKTGFTLSITAEFSNKIGLGSSAAVTAATVAVLAAWLHARPIENMDIFKLARRAVLTVQGVGSGADLAASIFGGVIAYNASSEKIIPLPMIPALSAIYCGYKTPTPEVIAIVKRAQQQQPKLFADIFADMHICVLQAITAIEKSEWPQLGALFKHHQLLQAALGTSSALIDTLIAHLEARPEILGAKISGSGLGDCVIGLGKLADNVFPIDDAQQALGVQQLAISIAAQGLEYVND